MALTREDDPEVGDALVVRVHDTGVGIAPEDHATVFEQFRQVGDTLTEKPQGTGLGLPICKQIVEHHAGRMWLESVVGRGVHLRLRPAARAAREGRRGRRRAARGSRARTERGRAPLRRFDGAGG